MIQGETLSSGSSTPAPAPPFKQSTLPPTMTTQPPSPTDRRNSVSVSVPDPTITDEAESSSIQKHLDRHRKSFHLPRGKRKPSLASLQSDSEAAAWHEQMNDVDEDEAEEAVGSRSVTFDLEELRRTMPDAVKMLQAGGEEWTGVDLDQGLERGYAWDVMFENQRGIHFLGKAYFSSNSLLPSDPSHFTLPGNPLPSASTLIVSSTSDNGTPDRSTHKVKPTRIVDKLHKPKRDPSSAYDVNYGEHKINLSPEHRNIKTAYSLTTFQRPGPQWEWVTPWMINMKVGTDEGGWRYNAWFKSKGWKNHAGPAGWAGWVRRREWVRLRMVRPIGDEDDGDRAVDDKKENDKDGHGQHRKDLKEIIGESEGWDRLEKALHVMSSIPLDREKLGWWEEGLNKVEEDQELHATLQEMLNDPDNMKHLHRAFTHRSTFTSFLALLESHNYSVAPLPSAFLPPPAPTSSSRSTP